MKKFWEESIGKDVKEDNCEGMNIEWKIERYVCTQVNNEETLNDDFQIYNNWVVDLSSQSLLSYFITQ